MTCSHRIHEHVFVTRDPISALRGFAIRSSESQDWGLSRSNLRRRGTQHPFHGMSSFDLDLRTTWGRCLAYEALLLPGQFFSHATAAALHGAPLPNGAAGTSIDVAVLDPRTAPRGRGVSGHRVTGVELTSVGGLPVVSAPDSFCQLGAVLSREDLVAVGDSFVTGRRVGGVRQAGQCTLDELRSAAARHRAKRGAARVGWALDRVRVGADSRPETRLRLLLTAARLPEPQTDVEVNVGDGLVLHPDLAYPRKRVALEYEGDGHRTDATTWRRDITRRELFEAADWRVIRVTSDDVFAQPATFVSRVRRILAAR